MSINSKPADKKAWHIPKGLQNSLNAATKPPQPAEGLKFVKGIFRGVNIQTAQAVLMNADPSFYGHKEILFDGFCAWVLSSANNRDSRAAIAQATARRIIAAEKSKTSKGLASHALPIMSFDPRYQPLFRTIYYPIGGLAALMRAITSAPDRANRRKGAEKEIRYLVEMATILDFHVRELEEDTYGRPNIMKAGPLAAIISTERDSSRTKGKPEKVALSTVHVYLKEHRDALAFLYAADRVSFDGGSTVLDRLLRGTLKFKDVRGEQSKLALWFSYSRYFTERVTGRMHGGAFKLSAITAVEAICPPMRELSADHISRIKEVIGQKAPSQRVVR